MRKRKRKYRLTGRLTKAINDNKMNIMWGKGGYAIPRYSDAVSLLLDTIQNNVEK